MLKMGGIRSFDNLEFVEADLIKDANWDAAVTGCDYVLHVASPIFLKVPKDENEMILPAVEGTLRVLKALRDAGVKRVVMMSNFGAVGYSHRDTTQVITEESWTDPNEKGLSAYNKSKVLAERAAWNFLEKEGGDLELSVINPVGIFGPSLGPDLSSGFELLKKILDGSMKAVPNMTLSIVDVRDVADLHIRAMTNPVAEGQRFLVLAGGVLSLPEIAIAINYIVLGCLLPHCLGSDETSRIIYPALRITSRLKVRFNYENNPYRCYRLCGRRRTAGVS